MVVCIVRVEIVGCVEIDIPFPPASILDIDPKTRQAGRHAVSVQSHFSTSPPSNPYPPVVICTSISASIQKSNQQERIPGVREIIRLLRSPYGCPVNASRLDWSYSIQYQSSILRLCIRRSGESDINVASPGTIHLAVHRCDARICIPRTYKIPFYGIRPTAHYPSRISRADSPTAPTPKDGIQNASY